MFHVHITEFGTGLAGVVLAAGLCFLVNVHDRLYVFSSALRLHGVQHQ